jgi:hypothetical protein
MKNLSVFENVKIAVLRTAILFTLFLVSCAPKAVLPVMTSTPAPTTLPPTKTPYILRMSVFPDESLQTIQDVGGGNFVHRYSGTNTALDPVSNLNIEMLSPSIARVSIDLDAWEPINDNLDASSMDQDKFLDAPDSTVHQTFEFIQAFKEMGDEQTLIGSIWYVPDWMVSNPEFDRSRIIPPEMVPEVIESITAWLVHARDEYGVDISYISFNEANLGVNVLLNAKGYIALIQEAVKQFAAAGINTKWLLGDSSNMAEAVSYAKRIYVEESIRFYLGPFSFHSWDATTSDDTIQEIGSFALENGLETWCTEGGWNANMWKIPKDFPTYTNALNQAVVYTRVLKYSRASSLLYWEMMGQDYSMNDGTTPYPILTFLSEFKQQFSPGAQVVKTSADAQNVKFVAARAEDGFTVLIVNRNPINEPAILSGLPAGTYYWLRMSRDEDLHMVSTIEVNSEEINLEIAPSSINFLTTRKP